MGRKQANEKDVFKVSTPKKVRAPKTLQEQRDMEAIMRMMTQQQGGVDPMTAGMVSPEDMMGVPTDPMVKKRKKKAGR